MKKFIKKVLPERMLFFIKKSNSNKKLKKLYKFDYKKYYKSYSPHYSDSNLKQIEARLMFGAHALEKGFSHNNFRPKFGKIAMTDLSNVLNIYNMNGFPKENLRYKIALSSIKNYIELHKKENIDLNFLEEIFTLSIIEEAKKADSSLSGIIEIKKANKINNDKINFKELALNRVSIREFSEENIDLEMITDAINISLKTPSVCNRQPSMVYIIKNKEIIKEILDIQGGYNGFKLPPVLLLVTASNEVFISPTERNESFIDGGLFSMSLLYSLEYEGLAACALNAMLSNEDEKKVKNILNVPYSESLIMFVAVGHISNINKVPKSKRDTLPSTVKII